MRKFVSYPRREIDSTKTSKIDTLLTLAFFITARTAPVPSSLAKSGTGTRLVLHGAPTREAAQTWAIDYVQDLLLHGHPEQKLAELVVIPIHHRLLTPDGDENIDWPSFSKCAISSDLERGASMRYQPMDAAKQAASGVAEAAEIERLKRQVPDAKRFNWNSKKQFYYVARHDECAFLVRAMNMLLVSRPYARTFAGTPHGDRAISVVTWPGARRYEGPGAEA